MFKVTRFLVVAYVRRGAHLWRDEVWTFYTEGEARALRDRMTRRYERVDLLSVTGWPVQDLWDRPKQVG